MRFVRVRQRYESKAVHSRSFSVMHHEMKMYVDEFSLSG